MTHYYDDARYAIRDASHDSHRCVVAYRPGMGWHIYDPIDGCPQGSKPEFLCAQGHVPLPLSEVAIEVLSSAITSAAIN